MNMNTILIISSVGLNIYFNYQLSKSKEREKDLRVKNRSLVDYVEILTKK